MGDTQSREIRAKEKAEVASPAEQTTPGPVFTPAVDIFESNKELILLADLPGVKIDGLKIDLRDSVLTLIAEVAPFEASAEQDILVEYEVGKYLRQFTLSDEIDQNRIDAKLKDGVLRLTLPKAEKAIPRKITVKSE